ncbi:hypothetical protein HMPREF0063_12301 [Aeromicrobium marinum DSM 15272]|uniref:DUF2568 domain-containing protein n=1 Tax=Aeromicrobium marinum DSM 15272 TaxID=585531 RepID=E2SCY9_9ACTN|nr:hypothetical protein HMPREF0063_12301 [Aeromicrobium marinum DSM 15272]
MGPLDGAALVCEAAMFALLVAVGTQLAGGWRGWALGIFLGLFAVALFVQWSSEASARRLDQPARFGVQSLMFLTVGVYAAAAGLLVWGVLWAAVSISVFALLWRRGG